VEDGLAVDSSIEGFVCADVEFFIDSLEIRHTF
jgi:hypothetical protein